VDDLISVVLPVYNADFNLVACLESILNQSTTNFEIIVIDDGSTDSSNEIISLLAGRDSRLKVFSFPENRGIVLALNYGLKQCRGKWVARMDADDLMVPRRLECQLEHAVDRPEVDIWGSRIELFSFQGTLSQGQIRYQDWSNALLTDHQIKSNIYAESPIMHPTFFLKRDFYEKVGGYRDHPWAEDYDFLLNADHRQAVFAKLPDVLLKKGDHPLRLAKTDLRCKRKAMFQAKAHYFFLNDSIWQGRKIMIMGSGSAGRLTFKSLQERGIPIQGFVDNIEGDPNRRILGIPAITLRENSSNQFFSEFGDCLFLLCIGHEGGRQFAEQLFDQQGIKAGRDYFRFI
jgi:glycosyltransferase involved in cell wall biosynthesis